MKGITPTALDCDKVSFEINGLKFEVKLKRAFEAKLNEIRGMPLPHFVYIVEVRRPNKNTAPLTIEYHGSFHEWARGKPTMSESKLVRIFADYVIDAAMAVTRTTDELIEACEMDTDMANKTWRGFKEKFQTLQEKFLMTTDKIVELGNVLWKLEVDGRLHELI